VIPGTVLLNETVTLNPGQDHASRPILIRAGSKVLLNCVGTTRFYSTLVASDFFDTALRGPGGAFPFPFGRDRSTRLQAFDITRTRYYRVVVRISAFNRNGTIQVELKQA
jgi:hypothetical protein